MTEDIALWIDTILSDSDGEGYHWSEEEWIEKIGESPTWRRPDGTVVWDLHPYIWDGQLCITSGGEVYYCYDQGGAL